MADEPLGQQAISDDQELAKVLAGITQEADAVQPAPVADPVAETTPDMTQLPQPVAQPVTSPVINEPATVAADPVQTSSSVASAASSPIGELDGIKLDALNELRPLVDKLNVSAEEKFDTYLLLLRSTDDKALIPPAHEAAKSIADEARRAQALLDIIKEIDFLSQGHQA